MRSKTRQQTLNLSSDLRRLSWWACDRKNERSRLIERFLALVGKQTNKLRDSKVKKILAQSSLGDWPLVKQKEEDRRKWTEKILTASLRLKHLLEASP